MVRSMNPALFRAPWPFFKTSGGWRKIGPPYDEASQWPGRNFGELHPSFQKLNPPQLHNYTRVHPTGYIDPVSKEFVPVPEMVPKIVAPDLKEFDLKPYVSYKTDVEIEKKFSNYEDKVKKLGLQKANKLLNIDARWPPEKVTPKTLFDHFYANKIKESVKSRFQERITSELLEEIKEL